MNLGVTYRHEKPHDSQEAHNENDDKNDLAHTIHPLVKHFTRHEPPVGGGDMILN